MNPVLVGFLFLFAGIGNAVAQQGDSVKLSRPPLRSVLPPKDSLWMNKERMKFSPIVPDYMYFDKRPSFNFDHKINLKLDRPLKGVNILKAPYSNFIIPASFLSYGILVRENDWLQELDYSTHHEVDEHILKRIHLDDYTQFAPAAAVYGLDFAGIKAKHNFRDRTFIMATSHLLMAAGVQTLKRTTKIERPDGSNFYSFPSGHTATAFAGAHILFKEYKDRTPWIGIAGYAVAGGTGAMRVFNKKHWVSDVIAGAGIGIISVEAGYLLLPVFHSILGIKDTKTNLVIAPVVGSDKCGVSLAYTF